YWLSPIIDFGRELYVPWQLASGKKLYEEIAYIHGPLSPYFNAAVFRLFGVNLQSIVIANLFILGLITILTFNIIESYAGRISGYSAVYVFLVVFSFNQLNDLASFNFICPYSHEMTHGILLNLASLWAFSSYFLKNKNLLYFTTGSFFLGLLFLTKVEMFFAGFCSTIIFFIIILWKEKYPAEKIINLALVFFGTLIVPVLLFFMFLSRNSDISWGVYGILGGWKYLFNNDVVNTYFQSHIMGIENLSQNLGQLLKGILWTCILILPAYLFSIAHQYFKKRIKNIYFVLACAIFCIYYVFLFFVLIINGWSVIIRSFPVVILIFSGILIFNIIKNEDNYKKMLAAFYFGIFSFFLFLRIIFAVRIDHYGFALAFPGTVLIVTILLHYIPSWLNNHKKDSLIFRFVAFSIVVAFCTHFFLISNNYYNEKTAQVSTDNAVFYETPEMANLINKTVHQIKITVEAGETLLVVPEGVIFNFLTGIANPLRQEVFIPPAFALWSEQELVNQLINEKPDHILLIHRTTYEYGKPVFGKDYAKEFFKIIINNYQPNVLLGARPFTGSQFGMQFFKKND
ncbi:MAG: glycosyltransferase family 39 protein, partial [Nitrososphaeraceae archaeon]|nr:glycosyltransferase family 39 protein [Nitrososphaeraceae archaeon]